MSYLQRIITKACDKKTDLGSELRIGKYSATMMSGEYSFRISLYSTFKKDKYTSHIMDVEIRKENNPEIKIICFGAKSEVILTVTETISNLYPDSKIFIQ